MSVLASDCAAPLTWLLYMIIGLDKMIYVISEPWTCQSRANSLRADVMSTRKPGFFAGHQSPRNKNAPAKPGRPFVRTRAVMPGTGFQDCAPYPSEPGSAIALTTSPATLTGAPAKRRPGSTTKRFLT